MFFKEKPLESAKDKRFIFVSTLAPEIKKSVAEILSFLKSKIIGESLFSSVTRKILFLITKLLDYNKKRLSLPLGSCLSNLFTKISKLESISPL